MEGIENPFEKELIKKIRNLQKKLNQIDELELKVKKENLSLNEAQKAKLADKSRVINQIDEVK